jgi:hypothetical protein
VGCLKGRRRGDSSLELRALPLQASACKFAYSQPDGARELMTDHVIAATEFRVDIDRVDYLEPSLKGEIVRESDGIPALDSTHPTRPRSDLIIVGITSAPSYGKRHLKIDLGEAPDVVPGVGIIDDPERCPRQ